MNLIDALNLSIKAMVHWRAELAHEAGQFNASELLHDVTQNAEQRDELTKAVVTLRALERLLTGDATEVQL